jgi:glycosyltransferase involved in cell wall biosynthesis
MHIAIDMVLAEQQQGGMFFSACALLEGLAHIDSENTYSIITTRPEAYVGLHACAEASNIQLYHLKVLFRHGMLLRHHILLMKALSQLKPDVLHVPAFAAPIGWRGPLVQTVHDLAFLQMPQQSSFYARLYWRYCLHQSVRHARQIIAVSEQTRAELVSRWSVEEERIHVVHNALRPTLKTEIDLCDRQALREEMGGRYILHVGRIMPRKNVDTLLFAFEQVVKSYPDLRLVLVGGAGYGCRELLHNINFSPYKSRIILRDWVSDEELSLLYAGASMLVFPSFYEGFGLPPMEAMACGTPAIVNYQAASQDVFADTVLRVNCISSVTLARAISRLLEDPTLREQLISDGRKQARQFTNIACARQTLEIYQLATGQASSAVPV